MGTNWYVRADYCDLCKRHDSIHIGKGSMGWKFVIRLHPELYKDFRTFIIWLNKQKVVYDEYGHKSSAKSFIKYIKSKQKEPNGEPTIGEYRFDEREFS